MKFLSVNPGKVNRSFRPLYLLFAIIPILIIGQACSPSKEKTELDQLRDSLRVIIHGGSFEKEISAEEIAVMERNAKRTADSIALAITSAMNKEENAKRTADSIAEAIERSMREK